MGDHSNARTVDWLLRGYFAVAAVRSLGLVLTYVDAADPSSPGYTVVAWVAPIHVWAALLAGIGLLLVGAAWRPGRFYGCLLYTSPSPRDRTRSRMPSFA